MSQNTQSEKRRGEHLFNRIAPVYGWFYHWQKKRFSALLDSAPPTVDLAHHGTVLDVGCGTGALCAALHDKGLQVCGVDPAARMLAVARKKVGDARIRFVEGNVLEGLPFEDKQFDLSFASYVAHGLKPEARARMYAEMARVTRRKVIIHDYNNKRKPLTSLIEWLEHGDYFHFIRHAEPEMRQCLEGLQKCFAVVDVVQVGDQAAWYICTPNEWGLTPEPIKIRRVPLSTASNMRDLGGYPADISRVTQSGQFTPNGQVASNGRFTQFGRLFRSDCPSSFTTEDVAWIQRLNIHTVIDMRSSKECEEVPSAYASFPGIAYHRCPFAIGANYPVDPSDIPNTYLAMFADVNNMSRILSHIAAAEGAVVFHCVAGKDRTGVVAATLLTLAGVPFDDVLADYQVSHTYLRDFLRQRRLSHPDMPVWAGRSESWYLEQSFEELLRMHNGIDGYLDKLGLSAAQRQALQERLLGGQTPLFGGNRF